MAHQKDSQVPYNVGFENQQPGFVGPAYPPSQGFQHPQPGYPMPQQGYQGFPPQQGGYVPPGYQQETGYQPGYPQPQGPGGPCGFPMTQVPGINHQSQGPIVTQPGLGNTGIQTDGWMNMPQRPHNCPPGLEYLTTVDRLLVKQKVELLEVLTSFETENKFTIKNGNGQKVFYASEQTDCLTRNFCGPLRPFEMKIMDNFKNQVIHLHRPLACMSCCFPCCLQSMEVSCPPGTVIGTIDQEWSILKPTLLVKDGGGNPIFRIEGPICRFGCGMSVDFKIFTLDGANEIGIISKQWGGLVREFFTDADYFGVSFPIDLDVKMKAVLLGAVFLVDMMFFEKSGNRESDRPGML
uniref:Phospholipid scramblase n=1 Tax=Xenopsylla cheopis TaxID=163159 RepID=A0A6M2DSW2_XENCH